MEGTKGDESSIMTDYADGTIGPISGVRMLVVTPGHRTVLRLKRTVAQTTLSMKLRTVSECGSLPFGYLRIACGVVGAPAQVRDVEPQNPMAIPGSAKYVAGDVEQLDFR